MLNVNKSACIIGGGFYGVVIALYLKRIIGLKTVEIYEQESKLISKASFKNQARIHNGYHYPRSFITAYRSRENFNKFISDFSECVESQFNNTKGSSKRPLLNTSNPKLVLKNLYERRLDSYKQLA